MEYQPVDSMKNPSWREMMAAHEAGQLPPQFGKAYFNLPRPVLELYDLQKDPAEFDNLAEKPELADVLQTHLAALQEKMIVDRDYLPTPLGDSLPKQAQPPPKERS
jgi:hypothetical protein